MEANWTQFKTVANSRNLNIQYIEIGDNYWLKLFDGLFSIECLLPLDPTHPDTMDFEANYKINGNKNPQQVVTTQFELNNKDIKVANMRGNVDPTSGVAVAQIKSPGIMANGNGRYLAGGEAFFDYAHTLDIVTKIEIVDVDNVLGYGAETVIKSYHDDESDLSNQGWIIGVDTFNSIGNSGSIEVETLGGYGFIPAELYLRITAQKDPANKTGTFFVNVFWGKLE